MVESTVHLEDTGNLLERLSKGRGRMAITPLEADREERAKSNRRVTMSYGTQRTIRAFK